MDFKKALADLFHKQMAHEIEVNGDMPKEHRASNNQLVGYAADSVKDMFFEYLDELVNKATF